MARWGREKERSAGLVRVSATLLAGQRPRDLDARNPTDSLATLPPPYCSHHCTNRQRRASLSARIFLGLIRPLGTRFLPR